MYEALDRQITQWGIEHNEEGWRADAYLYCVEVPCPECHWMVPMAPSWVIGEKTRTVARLRPDKRNKRFDIKIVSGVSEKEIEAAKEAGTAKDSSLICPNPNCDPTPMTMLRGDRRDNGATNYGLRQWENRDVVPRPDDVLQERLYCIRWVETIEESDGTVRTERHYRAPDKNDLMREARVLTLLMERFDKWQKRGYIPSRRIEPGEKTDEPIRTRGWTHWNHLFNPRQLLVNGLISGGMDVDHARAHHAAVARLLGLGRCLNFNSRLTRWVANAANEKGGRHIRESGVKCIIRVYLPTSPNPVYSPEL